MNIEGILKVLENAAKNLPSDARYEEAVACREAARIISQCRAAGFIDEKGEVRKVLGFYALNEDGTIFSSEDDTMLYREQICGDIERAIAIVELRGIDREYRWFPSREAARAAAAKEDK